MPKDTPSAETERKGVRIVNTLVEEMHFLWRDMAQPDRGIDGQIELKVGDSPTAQFIMVQVRTGTSYMRNQRADCFDFYSDPNHLVYWGGCANPVILVVVEPQTQTAWWRHIQPYISEHPDIITTPPHKIAFDKAKDRFAAESAEALRRLFGPNHAELEQKFREHVIAKHSKLTLYSVTSNRPLSVDLERVFVTLSASRSSIRDQNMLIAELADVLFQRDYPKEIPASQLRAEISQASLTEVERRVLELRYGLVGVEDDGTILPPGHDAEIRLSLNRALLENNLLVILGEPGAGKTTLLKYLALAFARGKAEERLELEEQRLPILVTLRDFNVFLNNAISRKELDSIGPSALTQFLYKHFHEIAPNLKLTEQFFPSLLDSGRCAVLLDGLDEVADPTDRARMAGLVAEIARFVVWTGNRFVVTSRPRGFEGEPRARLVRHWAVCSIRPFEDKDIESFTRAWYHAVTIIDKGDTPEARKEASDNASKLVRAIHSDARVFDLARTPLLLSVLAMVHQRNVELPRRRARLYEECTDFLVSYWDELKDRESATNLGRAGGLDRDTKRALLEPIALWLHERGEKGTEVDCADLERQIAAQFIELGVTQPSAKSRAREFLRVIEERSGLLVERSTGVFAFAHLTFQEYLAARALRDREDCVDYLSQHLHNPWWREVVLLTGSLLSEVKVGPQTARRRTKDFLLAIRNATSWQEEILRRDLLLAVRCLGDMEEAGVDSSVRDALTEESIKVWQDTEWEPQRYDVARAFAHAVSTSQGEKFLGILLKNVLDPRSPKNWAAVKSLRVLGSAAASPDVVSRLLAAINNSDANTSYAAIEALGSLGSAAAIPEAIQRLLDLSNQTNPALRRAAIGTLGHFGAAAATPAVMERLLEAIQDDAEDMRNNALSALLVFVQASATGPIVERLLLWLRGDDGIRRTISVRAFEILGNSAASPELVEAVLSVAQGLCHGVNWAGVQVLGCLGSMAAKPEIIAFLLALSQCKDDDNRWLAVTALGRLGSDAVQPAVLKLLLDLTYDRSVPGRIRAVMALGEFGSDAANPEVLERLVILLKDRSQHVSRAVISCLYRMGPFAATNRVLNGLLALIQEEDQARRWLAVDGFAHLGPAAATPNIVASLSDLANSPDEGIRESAILALGGMRIADFVARSLSIFLRLRNTLDILERDGARISLLEFPIPQDRQLQDQIASHCMDCLDDKVMTIVNGRGTAMCDAAYLQLGHIAAARAQEHAPRTSI